MASMNEQLMTQMEAMKIIRAQRRRDMQRLNGMMMKVLVSAELARRATRLGRQRRPCPAREALTLACLMWCRSKDVM